MDQRSQTIFTEHKDFVLSEVASRYGIKESQLTRLGSFESFVYEFEQQSRQYILKITHSIHRSADAIRGELDWTNFLADHGVSVGRAISSINGEMVEIVGVDDSHFLVYAFEKVDGHCPGKDDWSDQLFQNWGETLGKMHAATKNYNPPSSALKRHEWHEDEYRDPDKYLPADQPLVIQRCHEVEQRLHALPADVDSYGLIHSDLHHGNFFVTESGITVFDFDDCHYDWFSNDIAITLFYMLRDESIGENVPFARRFLEGIMTGYEWENHLDLKWMKCIPDFLKLREIELYIIIHAEDAHNLNGWCHRFMENRRERIEDDVPVIDMEFS
ncbi:MAG: phosphotransferase [candidate division Zixibacteria bacterium]|nr:phosphotransferase [candidate division Zixibacteria bacterium]